MLCLCLYDPSVCRATSCLPNLEMTVTDGKILYLGSEMKTVVKEKLFVAIFKFGATPVLSSERLCIARFKAFAAY